MTDTMVRGGDRPLTEAREYAKSVLQKSPSFRGMSPDEQKSIYLSLVQEYIDKRHPASARKAGNGALARSMATDSGKDMGYKGYDPGFGGDTQACNELVDSVEFPKFVAVLLKAEFDAKMSV
jgi:hypothetical protein